MNHYAIPSTKMILPLGNVFVFNLKHSLPLFLALIIFFCSVNFDCCSGMCANTPVDNTKILSKSDGGIVKVATNPQSTRGSGPETGKSKYKRSLKVLKVPKFDLDLFKKAIGAKNRPIDVIVLMELAYSSSREYDCSLSSTFGSIFFGIGNNPIGIAGSDTGIITYNKDANVHLSLNCAKAFTGILNLPTPIFNAAADDLDVGKALQLAKKLFETSNRPYPLKQILVFISGKSRGNPEKIAKLLKQYDIEIYVFAYTKNVDLEQVYSIASSPEHVFWFPDYCSASKAIYGL
ncbi:unnamed protein product [Gordionus sp. m RMFG-2023]|uniref:uncharacterized protein LOC135927271 n=1 Tax=Gordionus sp. m RMFG-2023 TaxID=3053472 RepID=UPI0030DF3CA7